MPSPKTEHHERLAAFVGTWRTESKMAAMPGVPGMEQATEMTGTETAELVCNGLWLKVTGEGVCGGQASSGLWLLGYDAVAGSYQCIAASNMDLAPCCLEARYDGQSKVWHFHGDSPMGPFRSEFVFETADRSIETCYAKGEDGKEKQFLRSVRTRVKAATAKDAAAKPAAEAAPAGTEVPAPLAALRAAHGVWDADFRMEMPGMPAMQSKCREVVGPICGGQWCWSDFTGEMMGAPFEGHALTGVDPKSGNVVSFWIDSMNGAYMRTDGTFDTATTTFALRGTCYDQLGKRSPVASTEVHRDRDTRELRMLFGEGAGQHTMTIAYRRAAK
ncbi:MAG: DUF1579 family protein [Planctomycetes bacterium]|nr:DUF1579 family protein [Planctomycetota bacterium]